MNLLSFKNMKFSFKLAISFGFLIIAMCIGGAIAVSTSSKLAGLTEKLYQQPYAVSMTIRDIETNLIAMHRSMKDVAMASDIKELETAARVVQQNNTEIDTLFTFLDQRFIGNEEEIAQLKNLFHDWTPIREKVITQRKIQLENDAFNIIQNKNEPYVEKILLLVEYLVSAVNGKAVEIRNSATQAGIYGQSEIVEKFYRHPYTEAVTATQLELQIINIADKLNKIAQLKTKEEVSEQDDIIRTSLDEVNYQFSILKKSHLGDKATIEIIEKLIKDWKPIRDEVISMRLAQLSVNPGEVTRVESGPLLEKISLQVQKMKDSTTHMAENFYKNAQKQANAAGRFLIFIFTIASIIGIAAAFLVTKLITSSLQKAVHFSKQIAAKDLTATLNIEQKDEIGDLANALTSMRNDLQSIFSEIHNGVATLSVSSTQLSDISNRMATNAQQTNDKANTVSSAAEEMSANMSSVSAASEETAVNVNMVAAAAEEMSVTIAEISSNSVNTRKITEKAVEQSEGATTKINELGNAALEIGKVTEAITEISEQTNLLALNATIEAARAGEAGKGFAVVANEIKELAKQTSEATGEIKQKISGIQIASKSSVDEIQNISRIINEVNDMVAAVTLAVDEQANATREISGNVTQASQGIDEVNQNVAQASTVTAEVAAEIAQVGVAARDINEHCGSVNTSAHELAKLAGQLTSIVNQFKM